jgi:hypothetical protein
MNSLKDLSGPELRAAKKAFINSRNNAVNNKRSSLAEYLNEMASLIQEEEWSRKDTLKAMQEDLLEVDSELEWTNKVNL